MIEDLEKEIRNEFSLGDDVSLELGFYLQLKECVDLKRDRVAYIRSVSAGYNLVAYSIKIALNQISGAVMMGTSPDVNANGTNSDGFTKGANNDGNTGEFCNGNDNYFSNNDDGSQLGGFYARTLARITANKFSAYSLNIEKAISKLMNNYGVRGEKVPVDNMQGIPLGITCPVKIPRR